MYKRHNECLSNYMLYLIYTLAILLFINACTSDENEWKKAINSNTIESYENYLAQYPKGKHADTVSVILIELHDWDDVKKINTYNSFTKFLNEYPEGSKSDSALLMAHDRLVAEFRPDVILFIGLCKFPPGLGPGYGVWRGKLKFGFSEGGIFTGGISFIEPDPSVENIAIVVNDTTGLPPILEKGKVYIWQGGENFIFWRKFEVEDNEDLLSTRKKITKQLGLNANSGDSPEKIPFYHSK